VCSHMLLLAHHACEVGEVPQEKTGAARKTWSSPFCLTMLCTTKTSAAAARVPLGHGLHGPSVVGAVDCLWLELSWPWLLPPEQQLLGSSRVTIISSRRELVHMCGVIMSEIDGNNKLSLWKLCGGHYSIITCHKTVSYLLCLCWCWCWS
jgi:hypothetical protein